MLWKPELCANVKRCFHFLYKGKNLWVGLSLFSPSDPLSFSCWDSDVFPFLWWWNLDVSYCSLRQSSSWATSVHSKRSRVQLWPSLSHSGFTASLTNLQVELFPFLPKSCARRGRSLPCTNPRSLLCCLGDHSFIFPGSWEISMWRCQILHF